MGQYLDSIKKLEICLNCKWWTGRPEAGKNEDFNYERFHRNNSDGCCFFGPPSVVGHDGKDTRGYAYSHNSTARPSTGSLEFCGQFKNCHKEI